ncbi:MAG: chloride channel protein [Myxococcota bacterium]|jgi:CIC family chloride channel protein|nr:chloride channel protein [Myxococcota bacterium]
MKSRPEFKVLQRLFTSLNPRTIYLYSIAIGLLSGFGAILFNELLHVATEVTMGWWAQVNLPHPSGEASGALMPDGPPRRWVLFVLPVAGGLVSGLLVKTFAPEAEGTGTDGYIDAFHNKAGAMRGRVPLVKSLATLATLSSGGSAGKEGPIAQIGAGIGSALGGYLKMGARARRTMMVAGAAGGLGAIFRAPLGGALTAVEVLYKEDLETDALTPAILSSVTAYTVFCSANGFHHVFAYSSDTFHTPIQLLFYAVLGLVCSGAGYLYVNFLHGSKRLFFDRLPINRYLVPPLGGLLVGLVGLAYPQVMGQGFGYVQQLILRKPVDGLDITVGLLATLAVLKIVTTSFTISSGGSGGVFAPSLFIGSMLGGCVGMLSHQAFPELVPDVTPFVIVGMGAFFAGVANAPIASLMMVSELTGAYELLPPLMVVAIIALVTSRRWSIYVAQVDNKFATRAHLWEMNPRVLNRVTIGEAMRGVYDRSAIVSPQARLSEIESVAESTGHSDLLLANDCGELSGLLSLNEIADRENIEDLGPLVVAHDLANRRIIHLSPGDSLIRALEFFGEGEFENLPIVETTGERGGLLGHINLRDIIAFYQHVRSPEEVAGAANGSELS